MVSLLDLVSHLQNKNYFKMIAFQLKNKNKNEVELTLIEITFRIYLVLTGFIILVFSIFGVVI